MQFLDNKKYFLNHLYDEHGQWVRDFLSSEFGSPSQIKGVESFVNQNYLKVSVKFKNATREICCNRNARVSKIKNGVFKNSVVVVENNSDISKTTTITALSGDTIFKFPVFKGHLNDEQIDRLFSDEGLSSVVLDELLTFDILKKYQYYDFICEDIPEDFWKIENIGQTLMENLRTNPIQYVNTENQNFIDESLVRARAMKTIEKHVEKAKNTLEEFEK